MANVFDVANFFIKIAYDNGESDVSNMKLNKLLYFAQGHCLSTTGKPLFSNSFVAWPHGPVVVDIYNRYSICGENPIVASEEPIEENAFTSEERELLYDVVREYGKYSASYLRNRTHLTGSPWDKTKQYAIIDNDTIREYFLEVERIPTFSEILMSKKIPIIENRDSDGYLILPKDDHWDKEYAI